MNERDILRKLAGEYFIISQQERFLENRKLHRAVNDLKMIRPVVLIDELPWNEMNINDELTLRCTDPVLRDVEWFFRSSIYKAKTEEVEFNKPGHEIRFTLPYGSEGLISIRRIGSAGEGKPMERKN